VNDADVYGAIQEHVARFFPRWEAFSWNHGPIQETIPDFRVLRIPPRVEADPWIYLTLGAWEATKESRHGFEFFLFAPFETPYHVETLAALADYHVDHPLRLGRTLELGRPWLEGSAPDVFFVTLPYPFGSDFENCDAKGRHVQILWLLPITREEEAYLRTHGIAPFEHLLESSGADFSDPSRRSLVSSAGPGS
jgi:hypothetical protein